MACLWPATPWLRRCRLAGPFDVLATQDGVRISLEDLCDPQQLLAARASKIVAERTNRGPSGRVRSLPCYRRAFPGIRGAVGGGKPQLGAQLAVLSGNDESVPLLIAR